MPKDLPKGVSVDRDRYGNVRLYYRAAGRQKVRLKQTPGTKSFDDEVACARIGISYVDPDAMSKPQATNKEAAEGTLLWLIQQYRKRAKIAPELMVKRARMLEEIALSKHRGKPRGDLPFAMMKRKHVLEIRDELRATPGAQNEVVKVISALFGWAVDAGVAENNPALRIKRLYSGGGFHTWSVAQFEAYKVRHPKGSKARLALYLAMFTGFRRSTLRAVGRQHERDGWLSIRPQKTAKSSGVLVEIPILPILREELDAGAAGEMTYLVNEWKRPYASPAALGNKMRDWCDQAGLPECAFHGLRKLGASIAAENGATDEQMMAIFGWVTKAQTTLYTKKANRKHLARQAIHKLVPKQKKNGTVPPSTAVAESGAKTRKKRNKINA